MREGVPMRALLCLMGIATAAVSAGFTDQQIEDARIWAHESNEAFGVCLQAEVQNKLHSRMAREDFALFIKGACNPETKAFRVLLVDYLTMKQPDIDAAIDLATAESVIQQWRDAATQRYVESADSSVTPAD
jgi:hypothetical protein